MTTGPETIKLLALDVDGVLTDGGIMLDDHGRELKRFCAADGVGLRTWSRLGYRAAIITGRSGSALLHRLRELGIADVIQGSKNKAASLAELHARTGVAPEAMAFLGDDWPDLPVLRRVGYPMAVANADHAVKKAARFVTQRPGGHGAVREAIEHLLGSQGRMKDALGLYDPS
jgi:3-deoxy-D-manno-octulosonate 8-phosphate phosphatase (KDO 8-P phosphatase)